MVCNANITRRTYQRIPEGGISLKQLNQRQTLPRLGSTVGFIRAEVIELGLGCGTKVRFHEKEKTRETFPTININFGGNYQKHG